MKSVISELRDFESKQELDFSSAEQRLAKELETARKEVEATFRKQKTAYLDRQQESIRKAKEDAGKEARMIVKEYSSSLDDFKKKHSKNFEKAVKFIFSDILKKNV